MGGSTGRGSAERGGRAGGAGGPSGCPRAPCSGRERAHGLFHDGPAEGMRVATGDTVAVGWCPRLPSTVQSRSRRRTARRSRTAASAARWRGGRTGGVPGDHLLLFSLSARARRAVVSDGAAVGRTGRKELKIERAEL